MFLCSILYEPLSQIYRGKGSETSQDWSHMFPNLHHNSFQPREDWCKWCTKMTANLNFSKLIKRCFLAKSNFFLQKFIGWYIEPDEKIRNFDGMGILFFFCRCKIQEPMPCRRNDTYLPDSCWSCWSVQKPYFIRSKSQAKWQSGWRGTKEEKACGVHSGLFPVCLVYMWQCLDL